MTFRKLWNKLVGKCDPYEEDLKALQRLSDDLKTLSQAASQLSHQEKTLEASLQTIRTELKKLEMLYASNVRPVSLRPASSQRHVAACQMQDPGELQAAKPPTTILQ